MGLALYGGREVLFTGFIPSAASSVLGFLVKARGMDGYDMAYPGWRLPWFKLFGARGVRHDISHKYLVMNSLSDLANALDESALCGARASTSLTNFEMLEDA